MPPRLLHLGQRELGSFGAEGMLAHCVPHHVPSFNDIAEVFKNSNLDGRIFLMYLCLAFNLIFFQKNSAFNIVSHFQYISNDLPVKREAATRIVAFQSDDANHRYVTPCTPCPKVYTLHTFGLSVNCEGIILEESRKLVMVPRTTVSKLLVFFWPSHG